MLSCPVFGRIVETTRPSEKQIGVLVLTLVVRAFPNVHATPILAQLHGYLSKLVSRTKLPGSVLVLFTILLPLISLISFISILLLDIFVPMLTPVS